MIPLTAPPRATPPALLSALPALLLLAGPPTSGRAQPAGAEAAAPAASAPSAAASAAPAAAASAPAAPASAPSAATLKRVEVIGSRAPETDERRRSTAAKIIIGRDEIEKYGDATVSDLLKRLPGVTTSGGAGAGRGGNPRMRGMGSGYTQLLIDGERVPPGFSFDSLAPEQIERIEVLRAPTAETGGRAIAGTINVITRGGYTRRINDLRLGSAVEQGRLQPGASWTRNDTAGELVYNYSVSVFHSERGNDGRTDTTDTDIASGLPTLAQHETTRSLDSRAGLHANGRLQWRGSDGGSALLTPLLVHSQGDDRRRGEFVRNFGAPASLPNAAPLYDSTGTDGDSRFTLARLNGQFTQRLSGGDGSLEWRAGAGQGRWANGSLRTDRGAGAVVRTLADAGDQRDTNLSAAVKFSRSLGRGGDAGQGGASVDDRRVGGGGAGSSRGRGRSGRAGEAGAGSSGGDGTGREAAASSDAAASTAAAGGGSPGSAGVAADDADHRLVAGAEIESNRRTERRVTLQNGAPLLADFGDDIDARAVRAALYVQDEWNLSRQWAAHAGLRWEGIATRAGGGTGPAGAAPRVDDDATNRSSVWTPLLHAVWKTDPKGRDQLRFSLTRSYRAPTLSNLIARPAINSAYPAPGANTPTQPDRAGNPALKPELATGIDVAAERYLSGGGLLSANLFHRQISNYLRSVTALETVSWASVPRYVSRVQNVGDASTQGIELEAKFRLSDLLGDLWPQAPRLDVRANASAFRSRVKTVPGPDNRLDQQPGGTANLGGDYRFGGIPLTLGGNLNWTPGYTTRLSEVQAATQNARRVVDAYALWTINPNLQLRFTASNLAPRNHVTGAALDDAGTRETAVTTAPSAVNWQLRVEMKL